MENTENIGEYFKMLLYTFTAGICTFNCTVSYSTLNLTASQYAQYTGTVYQTLTSSTYKHICTT